MTKHDKDTHPKHALRKVTDHGETSMQRLVLAALWAHSNSKKEAVLTVKELSHFCSLGRSSIFRVLASLEEKQIISRSPAKVEGVNLYKINV